MLGKRMEAEILEQPSQLARNCDRYLSDLAQMRLESPEVILLIARGSSDNAASYARYLFEIQLEIPVVLAAPSIWTRYGKKPRYPKALAIGISQSGAAPDVADVLESMRSSGHGTLAITNTPNSRITRAAEQSLLLELGEEHSIAATKTYSGSLLAIYQLARVLGAELPAPSIPTLAWAETCKTAAEELSGVIVRSEPLFALARGYDFATAHETALKLMECALLPCKAYSSADFEHGPKALTGHGSAAIVFGEASQQLKDSGCEVVSPPLPPCTESEAPLWNIFFGQWLALFAARARGLDPDAARHLSKVTETH
jgi:glucosamine--fructose-6-phosphate aminotransferase (isomerizing)